jgi:uncharacterized membrane protein YsdA (DUF1294 family)
MPGRRSRLDPNVRRAAFWALASTAGLCALLIGVARLAWPWSYLISINVVEAGLYARDKRAARVGGRRRVPEIVLLTVALAGGSPAALLAGRALRHKTVKPRYRMVFALVVCVQIGAIAAWLAFRG